MTSISLQLQELTHCPVIMDTPRNTLQLNDSLTISVKGDLIYEQDKSKNDKSSPRSKGKGSSPTITNGGCSNSGFSNVTEFIRNDDDIKSLFRSLKEKTLNTSPSMSISRATKVIDPEASPPNQFTGLSKDKLSCQCVFWDERLDDERDDFVDAVLERLPTYYRAEDDLEEYNRE